MADKKEQEVEERFKKEFEASERFYAQMAIYMDITKEEIAERYNQKYGMRSIDSVVTTKLNAWKAKLGESETEATPLMATERKVIDQEIKKLLQVIDDMRAAKIYRRHRIGKNQREAFYKKLGDKDGISIDEARKKYARKMSERQRQRKSELIVKIETEQLGDEINKIKEELDEANKKLEKVNKEPMAKASVVSFPLLTFLAKEPQSGTEIEGAAKEKA